MYRILIICIVFACLSQPAWGQNTKTISGTVLDSQKEPLIGATIKATATNAVTVADMEGMFSIHVPLQNPSIEVSYIGYETKTVDVSDGTTFNISLEESAYQLEDVVAIGYSSQKKVNLVGSVQSLSIDDAESRSVISADVLLQGKIAGLQLTQNSAQPGEDEMEIRLRGISSVDNNSSPLIIIDGIEGDLSAVNPKDIESISVLKDASSAAIYGNKASAGVIIINTKEGKSGIKVNYNANFAVHFPTRLPDPINDPVTYIDLSNEAHLYSDVRAEYSDAVRQEWIDGTNANRKPVDWKKFYFSPGFLQSHYVNLSGKGNRYDFSFSSGYSQQEGVVYSARGDKFNYRLKYNLLFLKNKLKLGTIIGGKDNNSHEAQAMSSILNRYLANDPTLFIKTITEGQTLWGAGASPLAIEELGGGNDKNQTDFIMTYNAAYTLVKGLSLNATYNMTKNKNKQVRYTPMYELASNIEAINGSRNRSQLSERVDWDEAKTFNTYINYDRRWKKSQLKLMAGFESKEYSRAYNQISIMDLKANQPVLALGDPNTLNITSSKKELANLSLFTRVSLNYKRKYLFEANFRRDGSSRFAKGKRYGNFPAISAAWYLSEEKLINSVQWIDNIKLRASAGRLGNERLADYYVYSDIMGIHEYYSFNGVQVDGTGTTKLSDVNTTWETVDQYNVGVDFSFLKSFTINLDAFNKEVSGMLAKTYLPISLGTGTNTPYQNAGNMWNRGVEVTVASRKKVNKDWGFNVDLNTAYIVNRVVNLGGPKDMWHDSNGNIRSEVGQSYMSLYGYDCIGIYQEKDFTWQNNSDPAIPHLERQYELKQGITSSVLQTTLKPGDLLLRDIDGDNVVSSKDKIRLGKGISDLTFAGTIAATYKNFNLIVIAQGQGYALGYLSNPALGTGAFSGQIFKKYLTERWTPETPQYRALYADKERMEIVSSYDMHNKAYLRIKNVQLGYTFPDKLTKPLLVSNLKAYITADNLLTITSFPKDFDPERNPLNNTVSAYPLIKTIAFGISLSL
jgi:TonB-linked SusC/RagA family outer membrane protein